MRPQGGVYGHDEVLKGVNPQNLMIMRPQGGVYGYDEVLKGVTLKI